MKLFSTRKKFIPEGEKQIVVAESWVVRWQHYYYKAEAEFFTDEKMAYEFTDALKKAGKLLKLDKDLGITVKRND